MSASSAETSVASSTTGGPFCGDGVLDPGEECDDGNVVAGDGCSADCVVECEPIEPMSMNEAVFKDPATFHCYRWTGGLAPDCWIPTYAQAEADCASWYGDVAALSTLPELEVVVASGIVQPYALDVLLGAQDVTGMGDWLWMNGEPWIYVAGMPPWNGAEPNGTFLEMYYDGSFNADIETSACGWVCERTPAGVVPPP